MTKAGMKTSIEKLVRVYLRPNRYGKNSQQDAQAEVEDKDGVMTSSSSSEPLPPLPPSYSFSNKNGIITTNTTTTTNEEYNPYHQLPHHYLRPLASILKASKEEEEEEEEWIVTAPSEHDAEDGDSNDDDGDVDVDDGKNSNFSNQNRLLIDHYPRHHHHNQPPEHPPPPRIIGIRARAPDQPPTQPKVEQRVNSAIPPKSKVTDRAAAAAAVEDDNKVVVYNDDSSSSSSSSTSSSPSSDSSSTASSSSSLGAELRSRLDAIMALRDVVHKQGNVIVHLQHKQKDYKHKIWRLRKHQQLQQQTIDAARMEKEAEEAKQNSAASPDDEHDNDNGSDDDGDYDYDNYTTTTEITTQINNTAKNKKDSKKRKRNKKDSKKTVRFGPTLGRMDETIVAGSSPRQQQSEKTIKKDKNEPQQPRNPTQATNPADNKINISLQQQIQEQQQRIAALELEAELWKGEAIQTKQDLKNYVMMIMTMMNKKSNNNTAGTATAAEMTATVMPKTITPIAAALRTTTTTTTTTTSMAYPEIVESMPAPMLPSKFSKEEDEDGENGVDQSVASGDSDDAIAEGTADMMAPSVALSSALPLASQHHHHQQGQQQVPLLLQNLQCHINQYTEDTIHHLEQELRNCREEAAKTETDLHHEMYQKDESHRKTVEKLTQKLRRRNFTISYLGDALERVATGITEANNTQTDPEKPVKEGQTTTQTTEKEPNQNENEEDGNNRQVKTTRKNEKEDKDLIFC